MMRGCRVTKQRTAAERNTVARGLALDEWLSCRHIFFGDVEGFGFRAWGIWACQKKGFGLLWRLAAVYCRIWSVVYNGVSSPTVSPKSLRIHP